MKKIIIFLLISSVNLNCINKFERANNQILLKAINSLKTNANNSELQQLEKKYLANIEKDIQHQVKQLSSNLKKLLGNFRTKFSRFKEKITLLKNNKYLLKQMYEELEPKNDLILTILGLKPVSIINKHSDDNASENALINIINKKFNEEIELGTIEEKFIGKSGKDESETMNFVLCHNPIFPLEFIKKVYPNSQEKRNFLTDLNAILISEDKIVQKQFIESIWNNQTITQNDLKQREDGLAFLLGYVPIASQQGISNSITDAIDYVNNQRPAVFRMLLISGNVNRFDQSPYILLSEKLYEYATVAINGIEYYLRWLNRCIQLNDYYRSVENPEAPTEEFIYENNFDHIYKIVSKTTSKPKILCKIT